MHECAIAQIKAFVYLILNSNNNIRVFLYPIPISADLLYREVYLWKNYI